jgi:spoIIIJ-associated protein
VNKEIITTGKTIDDAVAAAVAELGVPSKENIEYTVIEEPKKGLFGIGATPAKISAKAVPNLPACVFSKTRKGRCHFLPPTSAARS